MPFENLPKINESQAESEEKRIELELQIRKTISNFERDNNYKFQLFELDNILLSMLKKNSEMYLIVHFNDKQ